MGTAIQIRKLNLRYNFCPSIITSLFNTGNKTRTFSTFSSQVDEKYAITAEDDYETLQLQKEIEMDVKRNKSRLKPQHCNLVHGRLPSNEPTGDYHLKFKYRRMVFGKYGKSSNVNPGTLWPSKLDIKDTIEYESIAYPFSFEQLVSRQKNIIEEEHEQTKKRQERIIANLQKLDTWKQEIAARAEKKKMDMAKAKAKKDALIEEVKKHFGYKVDLNDEKFKEMLLLKERAQKKKIKEEKSKAKQDRLISDLMKHEVK